MYQTEMKLKRAKPPILSTSPLFAILRVIARNYLSNIKSGLVFINAFDNIYKSNGLVKNELITNYCY